MRCTTIVDILNIIIIIIAITTIVMRRCYSGIKTKVAEICEELKASEKPLLKLYLVRRHVSGLFNRMVK